MGSIVLGLRVLLAMVFVVAGAAKLRDLPGSRRALADFGIPARAVPIGAVLLPIAELATAVALIPPGTARWGGLAALLLVLAFIGGIANALRKGQAPDCHCFGQVHSAPAGRGTLIRNGVLSVMAAIIVWQGPGPSLSAWIADRSAAELVATAAVAAALVLGAAAARLWLERRDLRRDLADATAELESLPPGLPVGATAPGFSVVDLQGNTYTLESLRSRGLPIALIFISPGCGPCREMLPELGRWQATLAERITVGVISQGDPDANQPIAEEHGIQNMLLQDGSEVMSAYRVRATPSALLVTPDGAIGSSVVSSIMAIEPLIRVALRRGPMTVSARPGDAGAHH